MKRKTLLTVASALCAVGVMSVAGYGCGDDDDNVVNKPDTGTTPETSVPDVQGTDTGPQKPPAPPALGAQIDRMGRPAINTALNHTFDPTASTKGAAKDAYNQAAQATWATFIPEFSANLAVLDALNDVCGDQAFASQDAAATTPVQKYGTFGGVGADDRLWIKTDAAQCGVYLAVEANATGFLTNADCGGRSLGFDVIDITYSLAAASAITGVTDGIAKDDAKTGGTTFPYLAPPL